MQIHELATASNVESTDYVAVDNGSTTRKYNLGAALEYKAGDSLTGSFFATGFCTNSGKQLRILIPTSKYIKTGVTITPELTVLQLRGIKSDMSGGYYAGGNSNYQVTSAVSQSQVGTSYHKQGIYLSLDLDAGWGLATNTPVAGIVQGTITFS